MEASSGETAATTLALLEERVRRIDYILHGDQPSQTDTTTPPPPTKPALPAAERLRKLERSLQTLTSQSPTAASILDLQAHHPTLFTPTPPTTTPPPPNPTHLAPLLLAHAPLYTTTSSSLQTLASAPSIPDTTTLAKLPAQSARLARAREKQDAQAAAVAELRARSARLVEAWYERGVLEMGEKWAGWEERVREAEILVRRREARERREREGVV